MNRRPVIVKDEAPHGVAWTLPGVRRLVNATYAKAVRKHPEANAAALFVDLTVEPGKPPRWAVHDGGFRPSVLARPWTRRMNARAFVLGTEQF